MHATTKEDVTLMQHLYMIARLKKFAVEHTSLPEARVKAHDLTKALRPNQLFKVGRLNPQSANNYKEHLSHSKSE
jgi:hypothetical protein